MKWLDKYIQDVKVNKWVAAKFGAVVSVIAFIFSYLYNLISGAPKDVSIIIAIVMGIIWFPIWILFSFSLVRRADKIYERSRIAKEKEMEERRKKYETTSGKKINNKKKKKLRKVEEEDLKS